MNGLGPNNITTYTDTINNYHTIIVMINSEVDMGKWVNINRSS